jgi:DUF2934 family protein
MAKSTKSQSTTTPRTRAKKLAATSDTTTIDTATFETTTPALPHDLIAMRAYELYLGDGAPEGRDLEHWLRAESELRERVSRN